MKIGTYLFTIRFTASAILPEYKGSTLRGAFGRALKKCTCALRRRECATCMLASSCCYCFIFEGQQIDRTTGRQHPYIFWVGDDPRREYRQGDTLSFALGLFGRANEYLPHVVYAVQEMGRDGLGKNAATQGRFLLETVTTDNEVIYADGILNQLREPAALSLSLPGVEEVSELTVSCLTPLRLKFDNRLQDGLPFHILVRAALRRLSSLEAAYGQGEPELDYKGLVARAAHVRQGAGNCRWTEIQRYSSKQQTTMQLGGVTGRITYMGGGLGEFLPLLRYCEKTHLGKQTTFGLGRIMVAASP